MNRRHCLGLGLRLGVLALATAGPGSRPAWAHEYYAARFTIIHPWCFPTGPGDLVAPVFMRLLEVSADDRLLGASTEVAERAVLVSPGVAPGADVPARLVDTLTEGARVVDALPVPAGQDADWRAGGSHVQLHGLKHPLLAGRSYPLVLTFEKSGRVDATFFVEERLQ